MLDVRGASDNTRARCSSSGFPQAGIFQKFLRQLAMEGLRESRSIIRSRAEKLFICLIGRVDVDDAIVTIG